jgi:hypothetical protein
VERTGFHCDCVERLALAQTIRPAPLARQSVAAHDHVAAKIAPDAIDTVMPASAPKVSAGDCMTSCPRTRTVPFGAMVASLTSAVASTGSQTSPMPSPSRSS